MKFGRWIILLIVLLVCPLLGSAEARTLYGSVRDAQTGELLEDVEIRTSDGQTFSTLTGRYEMVTEAKHLIARKPGYLPLKISTMSARRLRLQPFSPKALYMSFWAAGSPAKRREFKKLINQTEINALVIDIKSSRGHIAYRSNIPLAKEIGAQKLRPLKDLPELLAELKNKGIYTIGRIVVFKDDLLAKNRPELAVHTQIGGIWQDREKLSWSDPFNQQVRDYNLAVVEEAAQFGFDEIQFDYIRFPSNSKLVFSEVTNDNTRVEAINSFLDQAKERLAPYPTMVSANIFGYICWKHKDGKIGQRLVDLGQRVDYLSPMLYPSGFPRGIPGYADPMEYPYEVINRSLQIGQKLSGLEPVRFRPWLQAFRDYAFDKRSFKSDEIRAQIDGSEVNGSHGWMLWNAASRFSVAGLQQQGLDEEESSTMITKAEVPDDEQKPFNSPETAVALPF